MAPGFRGSGGGRGSGVPGFRGSGGPTLPLAMADAAPPLIDARLRTGLQRRLVRWFRTHQRPLPWRRRPADPYQVLVSEAMLQQTQVATVIDYFHRFIQRFPTLQSLAEADEQAVLAQWQGLGYYRRARHLHAAARAILQDHAGIVPREAEALLALPGVGRYTAGAIASIAYDVPAPILDGNVARVLARWFAIDASIDAAATRRRLWDLAARLVPAAKPGDFNEALMELGATVCTPRQPTCEACPVKELCEANRQGVTDRLPVRDARRKPTAVTHAVLVVVRRGSLLLQQRGSDGLWAGMCQCPTREGVDGQTADWAAWISSQTGLRIGEVSDMGSFEHQTTHRTIRFHVQTAPCTGGRLKQGCGQWRRANRLDDLPLANAQRRVIELWCHHAGGECAEAD